MDYFREKTGNRPSVRINKPDLAINIHIAENECTLSLDSSGESLHRRGYRQEQVEAPLNEVLAAGMILMTGWRGECDLIARNIAPGVFRKEFGFEKWKDFDRELLDSIYNDDSQEKEFNHKIYGYDNNPKANEIATHNVKAAGLSKDIVLKIQPFQQFEQPAEKSIIITNPPYGERISSDDLLGLKHAFTGNDAWILSYRDECFDQIGLKPSVKIRLINGALECQFRQYQLFDGKFKAFKSGEEGKNFKAKSEERSERPRRRSEKPEFGKGDRKDRKPFGNDKGERKDRKDGDAKPAFRGRRAGDGKEFTRERKSEFKYRDENKPRTPRPSTDDGRPKAAPAPRYMHSRRKPEDLLSTEENNVD